MWSNFYTMAILRRAHVNVGFFFFFFFGDPSGLLVGTGRFMRHVKIRPSDFRHEAALRTLIAVAYADLKARLAAR